MTTPRVKDNDEAAAYWKGAYDRMASRNIEVSAELSRLRTKLAEAERAMESGAGRYQSLESDFLAFKDKAIADKRALARRLEAALNNASRYNESTHKAERRAVNLVGALAEALALLGEASGHLGCHCHGATGAQLKLRERITALSSIRGEDAPKDDGWDGLDCSCGGGWKVGHLAGCPEDRS